MFQLETYKLTPKPASKHEPHYCLGSNPANARSMATDDLGYDAMRPSKYRCARVKDTSELPNDVWDKLKNNKREWDKHVGKHKLLAATAIYDLVEGIDAADAEAVVDFIELGQIPNISLNIFGKLRK